MPNQHNDDEPLELTAAEKQRMMRMFRKYMEENVRTKRQYPTRRKKVESVAITPEVAQSIAELENSELIKIIEQLRNKNAELEASDKNIQMFNKVVAIKNQELLEENTKMKAQLEAVNELAKKFDKLANEVNQLIADEFHKGRAKALKICAHEIELILKNAKR